jgi:predicted Zn-ribbon and HTH transcriptional regulator
MLVVTIQLQLTLQISTFLLHHVSNAVHCLMHLQHVAQIARNAGRKYDVYEAQCNDAKQQFHSNYLFGHT